MIDPQELSAKTFHVYLVTNHANGKQYVGQTSRGIEARWNEHLAYARQGRDTGKLYRAIRKYGESFFTVEELERASTKEEVNVLENEWIARLGVLDRRLGYNLMSGGQCPSPNQELRDKLSRVLKGKVPWNLGRKMSEQQRAKMFTAVWSKPTVYTPEGIQRLRESKLGEKNPNYRGKASSPESIRKSAEKNRGRIPWNKGIPTTEEAKQKMRGPRLSLQGKNNHLFKASVSTEKIKQLRSIGFSLEKIAQMSGCSPSLVSFRLKGSGLCG